MLCSREGDDRQNKWGRLPANRLGNKRSRLCEPVAGHKTGPMQKTVHTDSWNHSHWAAAGMPIVGSECGCCSCAVGATVELRYYNWLVLWIHSNRKSCCSASCLLLVYSLVYCITGRTQGGVFENRELREGKETTQWGASRFVLLTKHYSGVWDGRGMWHAWGEE